LRPVPSATCGRHKIKNETKKKRALGDGAEQAASEVQLAGFRYQKRRTTIMTQIQDMTVCIQLCKLRAEVTLPRKCRALFTEVSVPPSAIASPPPRR
jgi:hypothetical protein